MQRSRGISLAEVLVALAIAMVISAAMASLFAQSVKSREQVDREGQRIEGGRYALDAMSDDIRLAGFYGDYMPRATDTSPWPATNSPGTTWTAPGPCETALASLGWDNAVTGPAAVASGTVNVPVAIFGYEGGHSAPATLPAALTACLPNYKSGTDVIVTRRVTTTTPSATAGSSAPLTTATMTAGEVYLQASNCSTQSPRFVVSATAGDFTMQNLKCSSTSLAPLRKLLVRIYYIASCNTCSPSSDGMPTLKVSELIASGGALAMATRALTPGIDDMHFEYGVDGSADGSSGAGSADAYSLSDAAPNAASPFAWQNVMSVKVWVLARDLDQTPGYSSNKIFALGTAAIGPFDSTNLLVAAADIPYKRNVFASTIRVVNPSGARELP